MRRAIRASRDCWDALVPIARRVRFGRISGSWCRKSVTVTRKALEAAGLDVLIRGLSMTVDDERVLDISGPLLDGLYAFKQRPDARRQTSLKEDDTP
jgi:hypothetical protein